MHFYADFFFGVHLGLDHHCRACVFVVEAWGWETKKKKKTYSAICGFVVWFAYLHQSILHIAATHLNVQLRAPSNNKPMLIPSLLCRNNNPAFPWQQSWNQRPSLNMKKPPNLNLKKVHGECTSSSRTRKPKLRIVHTRVLLHFQNSCTKPFDQSIWRHGMFKSSSMRFHAQNPAPQSYPLLKTVLSQTILWQTTWEKKQNFSKPKKTCKLKNASKNAEPTTHNFLFPLAQRHIYITPSHTTHNTPLVERKKTYLKSIWLLHSSNTIAVDNLENPKSTRGAKQQNPPCLHFPSLPLPPIQNVVHNPQMLQHNNQCDGGSGDGGFVLNGLLLNKCTKHSLKQNQVHPRRKTHGNKHTKNKRETNKKNTQRTFDETINQASKTKQMNKQQKRGLCVLWYSKNVRETRLVV